MMPKRPFGTASGALLAASGIPLFAISHFIERPDSLSSSTWREPLTFGSSIALLFAGLWICRKPRIGRWFLTIGVVSLAAALAPSLLKSPSLTLMTAVLAGMLLSNFWNAGHRTSYLVLQRQDFVSAQALGAAYSSVIILVAISLAQLDIQTDLDFFVIVTLFAITLLLSLRWIYTFFRAHPSRSIFLGASALVTATGAAMGREAPWLLLATGLVFPLTVLLVLRNGTPTKRPSKWLDPIVRYPERLLVATFFLLCLAGGILLALPICAMSGHRVQFVDAIFTAVSAVCVTGLSVFDVSTVLSPFGQVILVILIQLGGLGIMTFSTAAMRFLGRRLSLRHEGAVTGLLSPNDRSGLFDATQRLIRFTFIAEAIGALLLTILFFREGDDLPMALWRAIFTAISAFCNAGFALQTYNLIDYQTNPWILHVVSMLIIMGGLSPAVVYAWPHPFRRRGGPLGAQLAILTTILLLTIGTAGILIFEWDNTLHGLSVLDKIHNSWFQSATLRTAGFNSIDIAMIRPVTLLLCLTWMFIGGNPGGTAGGIKTTTAAVLFSAVIAAIKGEDRVEAFKRQIPIKTVLKASAVTAGGLVTILVGFIAMLLTQRIPIQLSLFEVVSATGTVGLSLGATSLLDGIGKLIIIVCMFIGRVGSLSLMMVLNHHGLQPIWERPEEDVDVG